MGTVPQVYVDPHKIKFSDYKYCVNKSNEIDGKSQTSLDARRAIEANTSLRRTTFILQEIVNDLGIQKAPWYYQLSTVCLALAVLWFRMFIHYMGQYLILKFIDAPVTSFTFKWYKM